MKADKKQEIRDKIKGKVSEPSYEGLVPASDSLVLSTLQWYHSNKDEKFAAKVLNCDVWLARKYTTLAWAKRMLQRGFIFSEKLMTTMNKMTEGLDAERPAPVKKSESESSIRDRIEDGVQAKIDYIIAELEGAIDDYVVRPIQEGSFNPYEWMQKNEVKSAHAKAIVEYFRDRVKEPLIAESGKDEELSEGYSTYSKNRLRALIVIIANIIKDAERLMTNQKVSRKPRTKKKVSVEKSVSKMKFKKEDDTFKVKSVDPVNIPGCDQLWIFNTKTRKLGVYRAKDMSGLGVKGSSITGFSEKESIAKTLRKPEKVLDKVVSGGKLVLRKVLDDIKSKESALNGRINGDVIILRVVK